MTPLQTALYLFAAEQRMHGFSQKNGAACWEARRTVDRAAQQLTAMGEAAAEWAWQLRDGMDTLASYQEEASFLTGLSIGLELGRL